MKKHIFLILALSLAFAVASCSDDDIKIVYTGSTMTFTFDGTEYTWVDTKDTEGCYAAISGTNLTLRAAGAIPASAASTDSSASAANTSSAASSAGSGSANNGIITVKINLPKNTPYERPYPSSSIAIRIGKTTYTYTATVELDAVPEKVNKPVTGNFTDVTPNGPGSGEAKTLSNGSFSLVRVN